MQKEKFRSSFNGYDKKEVSKFVDEVTDKMTKLVELLREKDRQITILNNTVDRYKSSEDILKQSIVTAKEQSTILIDESRNKALQYLNDARAKARNIINDAATKARVVENDTRTLNKNLKTYKEEVVESIKQQLFLIDTMTPLEFDNIEILEILDIED